MSGLGPGCGARGRRTPGRPVRRRLRAALVGVLLPGVLLAGACACDTGDGGDGDRDAAALQRVLDRQATAVRDGREPAYLATLDPAAPRFRASQRQVFANLRRLPLTQFAYEVTGVRDTGGGGDRRVQARAELHYRLSGEDQVPVTGVEHLDFARRDGRWYVAGEAADSDEQLWEQGRLRVARSAHGIVLGVGRGAGELAGLAKAADRAVSAVDDVWRRPWPRRVVLEVPASLNAMARLLGASPATYQDIAAVTTGEAGERTRAPADRIVVNPEAYGLLSGDGRQVVITHETVHVATRTHTGPATPLWLSEGIADWTAYRAAGRTPTQAAPELARAVRAGRVPRELPSDADFRFGSDPDALGRAYESGWLACRFLADTWGQGRLIAFYLRVGEGGKGERDVVDRALRDELGVSRAEFTSRWRSYVRRVLS